MAIDLGEVRIGLAVSDPLRVTAQPLQSLERRGIGRTIEAIAGVAIERGVGEIVVGLPLLLSGEEGDAARAARQFALRLKERLPDLPVRLWDERLTTVEAERAMIAADVSRRKRRASIDAVAAALILQGYLDAGGRAEQV